MNIFVIWSWYGLHIKWNWPSDDLDLWARYSRIQAYSWIMWISLFIWPWPSCNNLGTQTWPRYCKIYMCIEKFLKLLASVVQKLEPEQTHRHKNRCDWYYYLPAYADSNKLNFCQLGFFSVAQKLVNTNVTTGVCTEDNKMSKKPQSSEL